MDNPNSLASISGTEICIGESMKQSSCHIELISVHYDIMHQLYSFTCAKQDSFSGVKQGPAWSHGAGWLAESETHLCP